MPWARPRAIRPRRGKDQRRFRWRRRGRRRRAPQKGRRTGPDRDGETPVIRAVGETPRHEYSPIQPCDSVTPRAASRRRRMAETASAFSREDRELHNGGNGATASGRRLLRRPTTSETERILRECPPVGLTVPLVVAAIRRETGCSRATAYRAVSDAFAAGILEPTRDEDS